MKNGIFYFAVKTVLENPNIPLTLSRQEKIYYFLVAKYQQSIVIANVIGVAITVSIIVFAKIFPIVLRPKTIKKNHIERFANFVIHTFFVKCPRFMKKNMKTIDIIINEIASNTYICSFVSSRHPHAILSGIYHISTAI